MLEEIIRLKTQVVRKFYFFWNLFCLIVFDIVECLFPAITVMVSLNRFRRAKGWKKEIKIHLSS